MEIRYYQERHKGNISLIPNGIVTADEAADASGFTPAYVRRLAAQGRIRGVKRGNQWLIALSTLMAYKSEMSELGTQKHTPYAKREKPEETA